MRVTHRNKNGEVIDLDEIIVSRDDFPEIAWYLMTEEERKAEDDAKREYLEFLEEIRLGIA